MNEKKTLRVFASGDSMIPDLDAEDAGARRFIGRRYDGDEASGAGRWVPTGEVVEIPYRAEYVAAIRAGELDAGDAETARLAGVRESDQQRVAGSGSSAETDAQYERDLRALEERYARAQASEQHQQPAVSGYAQTQPAEAQTQQQRLSQQPPQQTSTTSSYPRAPIGAK